METRINLDNCFLEHLSTADWANRTLTPAYCPRF